MSIRYNDKPGDLIGPNKIKLIKKTHQKYGDKGDWYGDFECPLDKTIFNCRITDVRTGRTKSCGCMRKITMSSIGKQNKNQHHILYKFNEGDLLGPLQVKFLKRTHRNERGEDYGDFECPFDGNIFNTRISYVASGHTQSCGCLCSKGETLIRKILNENNILYETQKTFETCKEYDTHLYKFDFYLPDYNVLIEYDGEQHFIARKTGYFNEEKLQIIQQRDQFKNNWCKENSIKLIRISYSDYNKINFEYLKEKINEI